MSDVVADKFTDTQKKNLEKEISLEEATIVLIQSTVNNAKRLASLF